MVNLIVFLMQSFININVQEVGMDRTTLRLCPTFDVTCRSQPCMRLPAWWSVVSCVAWPKPVSSMVTCLIQTQEPSTHLDFVPSPPLVAPQFPQTFNSYGSHPCDEHFSYPWMSFEGRWAHRRLSWLHSDIRHYNRIFIKWWNMKDFLAIMGRLRQREQRKHYYSYILVLVLHIWGLIEKGNIALTFRLVNIRIW